LDVRALGICKSWWQTCGRFVTSGIRAVMDSLESLEERIVRRVMVALSSFLCSLLYGWVAKLNIARKLNFCNCLPFLLICIENELLEFALDHNPASIYLGALRHHLMIPQIENEQLAFKI